MLDIAHLCLLLIRKIDSIYALYLVDFFIYSLYLVSIHPLCRNAESQLLVH